MFLLARGRISIHKLSPEGSETVIKVLKPGEVFAEVILFEKKFYPVTAVALTDVLVFKLLRRDLLSLLRQEDFRNDFIAMLLRKQRYLADKIQQLTSQDVAQRLRTFLLEQYGEAQIQADINKKQLAAAIGATPETLSRLLQDLKRRKCLVWKQGIISVSPPSGMRSNPSHKGRHRYRDRYRSSRSAFFKLGIEIFGRKADCDCDHGCRSR